jgi:hypothetical protein
MMLQRPLLQGAWVMVVDARFGFADSKISTKKISTTTLLLFAAAAAARGWSSRSPLTLR